LPVLDPPPGGLEKLRARLALSRSRRAWLVPVCAAAAVCSALVVGFQTGRLPIIQHHAHELVFENPAVVRFGVGDRPSQPLTMLESEHGKTAAVRVEAKGIDFYWIAAVGALEVTNE
jgi:hypothetical protein